MGGLTVAMYELSREEDVYASPHGSKLSDVHQ